MANYISQNSDLMAEWDFEENTKLGLDPDKLTCGSNKTAHWKCGKGHSWEEVIYKRVNGKECPFCSRFKEERKNMLRLENIKKDFTNLEVGLNLLGIKVPEKM